MNTFNKDQARQSSANALKTVYYVIVGLAIAEALSRTFVKHGLFIGWACFAKENFPCFLLLCAFLPTICRFVHGASLHLDAPSEKRFKPLIDFCAFLMQGSFFYLMALSLDKLTTFLLFFGCMLLSDAIWLIVLKAKGYLDKLSIFANQWLRSDFLIIFFLVLAYLISKKTENIWPSLFIFVISFLASIRDYWKNKGLYFPT
jgi:hypothetical protein